MWWSKTKKIKELEYQIKTLLTHKNKMKNDCYKYRTRLRAIRDILRGIQ